MECLIIYCVVMYLFMIGFTFRAFATSALTTDEKTGFIMWLILAPLVTPIIAGCIAFDE